MIPSKLVLENFISHTNSEIDFSKFDAALLVGEHSGNPYVSNGVGKCLPGSAIIYDAKNKCITTIKDIVENKKEWVLGFSNNKTMPVKVQNWFKLGKKKTLKIELESGCEIVVAETHPVLTPTGCVQALDLSEGCWVGEVRKLPFDNVVNYISNDEACLIGLLLGDGTLTKTPRFTNADEDVIKLFKSFIKKIFPETCVNSYGIDHVVVNSHRRNEYIMEFVQFLIENHIPLDLYIDNYHRFIRGECSLSLETIENIENDFGIDCYEFKCKLHGGRMFFKWLESVGIFNQKSHSKLLPYKMWVMDEEATSNLLTGLWLTDGYISTEKRGGVEVSFSSVNYELCKMVRFMLLRLGIISKINRKKVGWTVSLSRDQIFKFHRKIKLVGIKQSRLNHIIEKLSLCKRNPNIDLIPKDIYKKYNSKLKGYTNSISRKKYFDVCTAKEKEKHSNILWSKVTKIDRDYSYEECFDIEVDSEEHLYIVDTLIVHNSAIFDSIRWCLTSKSRFGTKDKVVKRGKALCKVIFEFIIEEQTYKIVRRFNKRSGIMDVNFYKKDGDKWNADGLTCDTPTATNRKIIEIIKMSDDTLVNSIYFKQNDISGFASATTAKRKEILKEVLQIGIWDDFQQMAKDSLKQFEEQRDALEIRLKIIGNTETQKENNNIKVKDLEQKIFLINSNLESLEIDLSKQKQIVANLETVIAQKGGFDILKLKKEKKSISIRAGEVKLKRGELLDQIKINNTNIVNATNDRQALTSKLLKLAKKVSKVSWIGEEKVQEIFDKFKEKVPNCQFSQTELYEKRDSLRGHQDLLNCLKQDLNNLNAIKPGNECPTCLSKIDNPKDISQRRRERKKLIKSKIQEEESIITEMFEDVSNKQNILNRANEALIELGKTELMIDKNISMCSDSVHRNEIIQMELKNLDITLKTLKDEYDKIKEILNTIKETNIYDKLDNVKTKRDELLQNIDIYKKDLLELSIQHGILKGHGEELERKNSEKVVINNQLSTALKEVDVYKNLSKAFGKDGIQAIIMENVTEDLRKYTNAILKQICNDPMTIDFVTQKQTGAGSWKEQFDIRISVGSNELDFDDLSGGEQVRISIALRLALSQLLMRRIGSNVKFLLLDEVDQALDRQGIDALAAAILALSKNLKILVITHNEAMKEKFDNIITIQKGASGSILKQ